MRIWVLVTAAVFIFIDPSFADEVTVKKHKDLVFASVDDQELKLDLHIPETPKSPPLVVWIHGGGWRAGSKAKCPLVKLTQDGFAVASISYRFTDTAIFPAQIHDCKAAVRWLRANSKKYGYNAEWLAVAGSSAGGHLALLMGTSGGIAELEGDVGGNLDQSSTVQAIIDYFGPSDFVLRGKTQPERAYTTKSGSFALLGGLLNGEDNTTLNPQMEKTASPVHYVDKDDPPLLIFHGDKDQTVLLDQSQRISDVYRRKGCSAKLVVIPGAGHGGKQFFTNDNLVLASTFLAGYRATWAK